MLRRIRPQQVPIQVPVEDRKITRALKMLSMSCVQQHTCPHIPAAHSTIQAACEDKRLTWMAAQCYYSLHAKSTPFFWLCTSRTTTACTCRVVSLMLHHSLHLQGCLREGFTSSSISHTLHITHISLFTRHQVRSLSPLVRAGGLLSANL